MKKDTAAEKYLNRAIELAKYSVENGFGGPFGAVIVKNGKIIGEGFNKVTSSNDPTSHAEIVAIREACRNIDSYQLDGCEIYVSCEPCPMCLGAIYWARPAKLYYAATRYDAAKAGFDDSFIYDEISLNPTERKIPTVHFSVKNANEAFGIWNSIEDKKKY